MSRLLWRLFGRRLRWLAAGAAVRFALRRSAARSVDRATADLEDRLPAPVRRALDMVPADAARAGGSAVVAARTARKVAVSSRTASKAVNDRRRRVTEHWHRLRSIGTEIGAEAESKRRELKAEYLRATDRPGEADDVLLDVRAGGAAGDNGSGADADLRDQPLDSIAQPVRPGRRRARRPVPAPPVNRAQRSYRPRSMPWDR